MDRRGPQGHLLVLELFVEQSATISGKRVRGGFTALGKKVVALVAVGAVVLLAGCSNVNAAATVDGEVMTTSQLNTSIASIMKLRSTVDASQFNVPSGIQLKREVIGLYITTFLSKQSAGYLKLKVTEADANKFATAQVAKLKDPNGLNSALIQSAVAREDLPTYFKREFYLSKVTKALGEAADSNAAIGYILDYSKKIKITINPRYGAWDATKGTIIDIDSASGAVKSAPKTAGN